MSLSHLKQFFIIGFLGLALSGCGSEPKVDDAGATEAKEVSPQQADRAEQSAVNNRDAGEGKDAEAIAAEKAEAEAQAQANEAEKLFAQIQGKVVNFDFDRSEVKPEFREVIKLNADYLSLNKAATVTLEGHCDERGTQEYNLALGERRANAVKNALIAEGITPSRINIISFGEEKPVDAGHNETAWAKNRRTEFTY